MTIDAGDDGGDGQLRLIEIDRACDCKEAHVSTNGDAS